MAQGHQILLVQQLLRMVEPIYKELKRLVIETATQMEKRLQWLLSADDCLFKSAIQFAVLKRIGGTTFSSINRSLISFRLNGFEDDSRALASDAGNRS